MQIIPPTSIDLPAAIAELEHQLAHIPNSEAALRRWLDRWWRLADQLDEEGIRRSIAKDQALADEEVQQRHLQWVEEVEPRLKPLYAAFSRTLVAHPELDSLQGEYAQYIRRQRNKIAIYTAENTPLEASCETLVARFFALRGSQDKECDWSNPDREQRRESFRAMSTQRCEALDEVNALVDQLSELRQQQAANAGFDDFRALRWRQLERFDYTPEDCLSLVDGIAKTALPPLRKLDDVKKNQLGLEALRPWDQHAEAPDSLPLKPYAEFDELLPKLRHILGQLSPAFAADLDLLASEGLLDIEKRPGKSPFLGYQQLLRHSRRPFLLVNVQPTHGDLSNLFHEMGHACHSLRFFTAQQSANWDAPLEFAETVANAFQLICGSLLDNIFYTPAEARRARYTQLAGLVENLVYTARGERFLHWFHTHPGHTPDERSQVWLATYAELGRPIDWSGYQDDQAHLWIYEIPHFFFAPFYWIEYLYGQLGAIQLWRNFQRDPQSTIAGLEAAMALGKSAPLKQLFATAGIQFDIDAALLNELLSFVEREIEHVQSQ